MSVPSMHPQTGCLGPPAYLLFQGDNRATRVRAAPLHAEQHQTADGKLVLGGHAQGVAQHLVADTRSAVPVAPVAKQHGRVISLPVHPARRG
jgi:hypothetical protein